MQSKFLTSEHPEYLALVELIKKAYPIHVYKAELEWILWEARFRRDTEKSGQGIQTAKYDANKIFKRQTLGLLGEFAFYKFATAYSISVKADFTRNVKKEDMHLNGKPIGVKLCVWQDGAPMTPQVDIERFKRDPIPQAIIYVKFNNQRMLDSGWEICKTSLDIDWICCIAIIPPDVLLAGLDRDYGVSSNPYKAGFIRFSLLAKTDMQKPGGRVSETYNDVL